MQSTAIMEFLAPLSNNPLLQGSLAALCTFILEDPTTISCGLLVGTGNMSFWVALIGLSIGIALGDIGLYGLGRLLGKGVLKRGWLTKEQLDRGRAWGEGNLFSTLFAARFIPGARFPTYLTAGVLKVSFLRFAVFSALLSVVWTTLLLTVTSMLGDMIFDLLWPAKWVAALVIFSLFILYVIFRVRRIKRQVGEISSSSETGEPPSVSSFELWPPSVFYFPVLLYYCWLSLRYGGPMTPFAANPSIYSSGICRESKNQILSLIPESAAPFMLKRAVFTKPINPPEIRVLVNHALDIAKKHGLQIPFVAKPDEGQRGDGVQPIRSKAQFARYLAKFPADSTLVLQELAAWKNEVGVFYVRRPSQKHGKVISITLKEFPFLTGDGESSIEDLIMSGPRTQYFAKVYKKRHQAKLSQVLAKGEQFPLVFSGNHCQGAIFRNGNDFITPEMEAAIDAIASKMKGFYFGRFDLRYNTLESLTHGQEFQIIEVNGASSESTHIWDSRTPIKEAYKALFLQFRLLFEIGLENRRKGYKRISSLRFVKDLMQYQKTSRLFPPTS